MTIALWITLSGIIVAASVALSVAYMHRKQMRQLELYRRDPNTSLKPPPHFVTRFLTRYWYFLFPGLWDLYVLVRDLNKTTPLTRIEVLYIALDISAILSTIVFAIITSIIHRIGDVVEAMTTTSRQTTAILEKTSVTLAEITKQTAKGKQ